MECGSYKGNKLLEYAMKAVERIFENSIRQQIIIGDKCKKTVVYHLVNGSTVVTH